MIQNWKDTAFGSDFGGDFLTFVEEITAENEDLSMNLIFQNTDLRQYLDNPALLERSTANNVYFTNNSSKFEQYIHFEDLIIGLSAIVVESKLHKNNGHVDLTKAYGNKILKFVATREEIRPVYQALKRIYNNPDDYVLFEMCLGEERNETLVDMKQIMTEFEKLI